MINKVTLIGRLGGDPEMRHLEGGTAVARFSLATNEYYKDKDGNPQETTEWHNVVVWRELAERAEKQLKKGGMVYLEGKITYRKYTGQDGQERNVTDIVASMFRNLTPRDGSNDPRFPSETPAYASRPAVVDNDTKMSPVEDAVASNGGDDLPF